MDQERGKPGIYGLLVEFERGDQLLSAAQRAYAAGYRRMEGYAPFPVEHLASALGKGPTRLPWMVLAGGVLLGATAYFLQWYSATIAYPWNVGGRPLHSWPAFIPMTFEWTILGAALAGVFGMILANRLPMPYHPLFNVPSFTRASRDRFFLCIEASDPQFDPYHTRRFLESLTPIRVEEVAW